MVDKAAGLMACKSRPTLHVESWLGRPTNISGPGSCAVGLATPSAKAHLSRSSADIGQAAVHIQHPSIAHHRPELTRGQGAAVAQLGCAGGHPRQLPAAVQVVQVSKLAVGA